MQRFQLQRTKRNVEDAIANIICDAYANAEIDFYQHDQNGAYDNQLSSTYKMKVGVFKTIINDLYLALQNKNNEVALHLLQQHSFLRYVMFIQDPQHKTPLMIANLNGMKTVLEYLLKPVENVSVPGMSFPQFMQQDAAPSMTLKRQLEADDPSSAKYQKWDSDEEMGDDEDVSDDAEMDTDAHKFKNTGLQ